MRTRQYKTPPKEKPLAAGPSTDKDGAQETAALVDCGEKKAGAEATPKKNVAKTSPGGEKAASIKKNKVKKVEKLGKDKSNAKQSATKPTPTLRPLPAMEGLLPDSIVQAIAGKKRQAPETDAPVRRDAAGGARPAADKNDDGGVEACLKKRRKRPGPGDVVTSAAKAGVDIMLLGKAESLGASAPSAAALEFSKQRFEAGPTGQKRSMEMLNTRKGCKVPVAFVPKS